jgi:hypothetical protein
MFNSFSHAVQFPDEMLISTQYSITHVTKRENITTFGGSKRT